jgi:site-specific DNA-cytosine methylase
MVDNTKLFRDIRQEKGEFKELPKSDFNVVEINQGRQFSHELIGGYDRVGTLTTQNGCGEKAVGYGDWFRYLTPLECERLQGFPDGWTEGSKDSDRYFALGNAVNCRMSEYLFTNYLKDYVEKL